MGQHIASRSFNSQLIPITSNILEEFTLTQLCLYKKSPLPIYTLSLQIPRPLQPRPSSMNRIIQRGEIGSYLK